MTSVPCFRIWGHFLPFHVSGFGVIFHHSTIPPPPPVPNPLADLDPLRGFGPPPTNLNENIILNVLVKMDDTLRSSAF